MIKIESRKNGDVVVLSVGGRMDAVTTVEFDKASQALLSAGEKKFILDLSSLSYVSSAGLRSILALAKGAQPGNGKVVVAGLSGIVRDIFEISGFASVFTVSESVEGAFGQL